MLSRFAIALAIIATACVHTTATIPATELAALHTTYNHHALVLHDAAGRAVRLDPSSTLRFQHHDGTFSPWFSGHTLRVGKTGVTGELDLGIDETTAVRVDGMSPTGRQLLAQAGWLPRPDGWLARPAGSALPDSLAHLIDELAWLNATVDDLRYDNQCDHVSANATAVSGISAEEIARGCHETQDEMIVGKYLQGGAPDLGRWTLQLGSAGTFGPIGGAALHQKLQYTETVSARRGVPWAAIDTVQIRNVDGRRSAGEFVGSLVWYPVLTAVMLSLVGTFSSNINVPNFPGSEYGRVEPAVAADTSAPDVASEPSTHLFAWQTRAKAYARPILSLDSGVAFHRPDALWSGVTAVVRFDDVFELGGGVRNVAAGATIATAGSMRIGVHYDLDPARRYGFAMGFDLGSLGGDDREVRVYAGLRARISDHAFVGLYPANPTYAWSKSASDTSPHGGRLPTAVEIGWAF